VFSIPGIVYNFGIDLYNFLEVISRVVREWQVQGTKISADLFSHHGHVWHRALRFYTKFIITWKIWEWFT